MTTATPAPPKPVLEFLVRYLSAPEGEAALIAFRTDLLDLEVRRARHNLLSDLVRARADTAYRMDIHQAERALDIARRPPLAPFGPHDTRCSGSSCWVILLGHRLGIERGLGVKGLEVLPRVAATRLDLPPGETGAWPVPVLFETFTRTVLLEEWDYPGLDFRDLSPARMEKEAEQGRVEP